ncbi:MAG: hypothetical protein AAF203_03870, partial [Pseudomonadota bacterium]
MNEIQAQLALLDMQKCVAIGLGLAAVYYVLFFNSGATIDAQTAAARAEITKNQTTLQKVRKALEDQKNFEKDIKNITKNMKDFQKFFAADMTINDLQSRVSEFAEGSNLVVNSLKPSKKNSEFPDY